ncbi:MAG: hypothetical protein CMI52_04750 [Parcubacteria group bacterium]|nr:hypothetical protein [Parcubacteria group bacterium]
MMMPMMFGLFVFVPQADAQVLFKMPDCTKTGDCQLNDAVNTLIAVAEFIFGISGSLALLMFMYGGFTWVTSGGSEQRITKGRDIVRNAVVGLIIVFMSAAIVQFALVSLDVDGKFNFLKGKDGGKVEQQI